MKLHFYCVWPLLILSGWSTPCHNPRDISAPVERYPLKDTVAPKTKDFLLFHLVRYRNTPVDLMPYLHPTKIANEKMLLDQDGFPNSHAIEAFAKTCPPHVPVTLDLESWPYWPDAKLTNTIDNFLMVIGSFKRVNTSSPIGFYGVPPKQIYQWKSIDPADNPKRFATWKKISDSLGRVAQHVDIFLPSFYAYDPDTASWRKMVDMTISAIKRYHQSKPIYAYIWPQYHQGSTPNSLQFIDTAIWRYELEILYNRVDGCIIWTSNKDSNGNIISWDPNMLWWQTTKSFLVNKGLVPPFVLDNFHAINSRNAVKIRWATSTDTTTNYFIVQHGADTVHFQDISGHIESIPTHYTENKYKFTDNDPIGSRTYYRLLIVDKKNNKKYSAIISNP